MLSTCACTDTSSAEVGSSQTRNSGCVASARAIEMRWRWPPENWCGNFSRVGGGQPDRAQQLGRRVACAAPRSSLHEAVLAQRLGDDVLHLPARIQAGVRVLEDHLHAPAQHRAPAADAHVAGVADRRRRPGRASARTGRPAGAPPCSCRSPIRRPAPASCRVRSRSSTPSTACTNWRGLRSSDAVQPGRRDVEGLGQVVDLDQRRALTLAPPASAARAASTRRVSRRPASGRAARRGSGRTPAGSAG